MSRCRATDGASSSSTGSTAASPGFAPWFSDPTLKTATLWNQPVLPTLRNPAGLPPRNLFSGGTTAWNLEIVNNSNRAYRSLTLEVALAGPDGKTVPVASLPAGELPAQRNAKREVQLTMPETGTRLLPAPAHIARQR